MVEIANLNKQIRQMHTESALSPVDHETILIATSKAHTSLNYVLHYSQNRYNDLRQTGFSRALKTPMIPGAAQVARYHTRRTDCIYPST
ncbi:MAG: hypothetical protein CL912_06895 [Deltaproteobacteria bacterium]|nr:hypothetical protein [Deltaproteobacteria bacterium]